MQIQMNRLLICLALVAPSSLGCNRDTRVEIPEASDPAACRAVNIGAAENLGDRHDLPVDRVVTLEGLPHQAFFGWTEEGGRQRAISKLMGTERRLLVVQDFDGDAPTTSSKMTGLLRRWSDLPSTPFDQVKQGIKTRWSWEIPTDAYVLLEGKRPRGCQ